MRLVVKYSSGFSADLWGWDLEVTHASENRVAIAWATSCYEPEAKHEHRTYARALPAWCVETLQALTAIDLSVLPPRAKWNVYQDDAPTLSVRHEQGEKSWEFDCFLAPKLWPPLPEATRSSVLRIFDVLEPIARRIHIP